MSPARHLAAVLLALLPAVPVQAQEAARTTTLEITVTNLRSDRGVVRVAVCPQSSFLQPVCPWKASVPAQGRSVTLSIAGIPPGTYAAQAYQDETDIHRIPRSLLGIPEVGIGFSNNAAFHFGPPSFAEAAFRLLPEGGRIALRLRYFD